MCNRRSFLLFVCSLQLLTIIERQIFDFLGFMWAPILANFFQIIFIIFGFFGAWQFHAKYLISYSIWNVIWIVWNAFLICFYLNIGIFDRESDLLNFGTGSVSWFEVNGYGCKPIYPINLTSIDDPFRPIRPSQVDECFVEYPIVEVFHSSVQSFLAFLGLIGACCIGKLLWDDDDDFEFMGCDAKSPQHTSVHPMYVSYSSIPATGNSSSMIHLSKKLKNDPSLDFNHQLNGVVITSSSINKSLTNSLSSAYMKSLNQNTEIINNHQQLSDKRQLSNPMISKSASAQLMMKHNYNHQLPMVHSGPNRSDMRYTEVPEDDVETNSQRSYFMPSSSTISTALASPIGTNKLMAINMNQQQLIRRNFGIQQNPLNNLILDEDEDMLRMKSIAISPPPRTTSNNSSNGSLHNLNRYPPQHNVSSPPPYHQHVNRSPNLNHMPRRRQSQQQQQSPSNCPMNHQLEQSHSSSKLTNVNFCDQIRDRPAPGRYNINQFIPECHQSPNPLPAIPPHMFHNPNMMYRVRSEDRIINRLKRQSGCHTNDTTSNEHQRPRSFCNNMINYQDYKDPTIQ